MLRQTFRVTAPLVQSPALWEGLHRCISDQAKQAVEKTLVVDTLKMVRILLPEVLLVSQRGLRTAERPACLSLQTKTFEGIDLSRQQSERLTEAITGEIILDRMRLSEKFVPKIELEKVAGYSCVFYTMHVVACA